MNFHNQSDNTKLSLVIMTLINHDKTLLTSLIRAQQSNHQCNPINTSLGLLSDNLYRHHIVIIITTTGH